MKQNDFMNKYVKKWGKMPRERFAPMWGKTPWGLFAPKVG